MRRSIPAALVVIVGLVLLADFLVANPTLGALAGGILDVVVVLFATAAVLGLVALALRHARTVTVPGADRVGSGLVLLGMAAVLVPGLATPDGAADPLVRWIVAALIVPLGASLLALVAIFVVPAARRGMRLRPRETTVLLVAAMVTLILLLPVGGAIGTSLGAAADWALAVPIRAVFAGLLIGAALAAAVAASRILFGLGGGDD